MKKFVILIPVYNDWKSVFKLLENLPCEFERVRFMKLEAGKIIGKHSDKVDKQIGFNDGDIVRIHVPIRTNENVIFTLYESPRDKIGNEYNLKTGHYYYTDVHLIDIENIDFFRD